MACKICGKSKGGYNIVSCKICVKLIWNIVQKYSFRSISGEQWKTHFHQINKLEDEKL